MNENPFRSEVPKDFNSKVALWPKAASLERVDVSTKGRRFGPLAEKAYGQLGYNATEARAAAEKLEARFAKKMGGTVALSGETRLSIYKGGAQLTVDGRTETLAFLERRSEDNRDFVRLGVPEVNDRGRMVPRGLVFKAGEYGGMQNFLERFYRNVAGYESTAASEAAQILEQKFVMAGQGALQNGDLLTVGLNVAQIDRVDGKKIVVEFPQEAALTARYEAQRAAVLDSSRAQRVALAETVDSSNAGRTYGDRWKLEGIPRDEAQIKKWDEVAEGTRREAKNTLRDSLRVALIDKGLLVYSLGKDDPNRCLVFTDNDKRGKVYRGFYVVERSGSSKNYTYNVRKSDREGTPRGDYIVKGGSLDAVKNTLSA